MRFKYAAAFLLAALTAWIIPPAKTVASQKQTASLPEAIQVSQSTNVPIQQAIHGSSQQAEPTKAQARPKNGWHSTRAEKQISVEALQGFLARNSSPLAGYSAQILTSPYWSTIIGICTIEQYGCTKAPGNNYWGIGPGKRFADIPAGITAISDLLASYDAKGKDTIEELNGYYVVPASANWYNTVLTTKLKLESLTSHSNE